MSIRIPRFDYRDQYHALRREILQAIDHTIAGGSLILGPQVQAFEQGMCEFLGASGQAVGVGSGTDALAIAMRALHIGSGDEVITVANTAVATVSAIRMVGATPVFCDVDSKTLLIDPTAAEKRITGRTRAIIPVHLFGNAADMRRITRMASLYGLYVIEDCAQACGATLDARKVGTWGDVGCFSFYPTKNLGAFGDGGLCFTRNREVADAMRQIRNYGCASSYSAEREGVNSRLDEIQAAILNVKLRYLPQFLDRRRRVAREYRDGLGQRCEIPATTAGAEHSHHLFVVRTQQREQLIARLSAAGIECGIHYPMPIHLMPAYSFLGCRENSLPMTERAAQEVLSLPCYPELSTSEVQQICEVVHGSFDASQGGQSPPIAKAEMAGAHPAKQSIA